MIEINISLGWMTYSHLIVRHGRTPAQVAGRALIIVCFVHSKVVGFSFTVHPGSQLLPST